MEVHFSPEIEAMLTSSAAKQGQYPDELVQDVVTRYFEEEARFVEAVTRGEDALKRGEHLTHEEVGHRLQRFLQS